MEKEYYKNLAEKYFAENITESEISELAGWIRNNVQLSDWWEEEFEKSDAEIPSALRDKMFARIKAEVLNEPARTPDMKPAERSPRKVLVPVWAKWAAMICIPIFIAFFTYNILSISDTGHRSPFIVKEIGRASCRERV